MKHFAYFLISLIAIYPFLVGMDTRYKNFEKHKDMLKNNVVFCDNLTFPQQFTICAVNNTINLYAAKIFRKDCREVIKYKKYKTVTGHTIKKFIDRYTLCDNTLLEKTISVVWKEAKMSLIWFSSLNILSKNSVECNGTELQKIMSSLSLVTNKNYSDPNQIFIIEYGKIPNETYPAIYYGIEPSNNNSEILIRYVETDPIRIVEAIYPIFMPPVVGIFVGSFIFIICALIWEDIIEQEFKNDEHKTQ